MIEQVSDFIRCTGYHIKYVVYRITGGYTYLEEEGYLSLICGGMCWDYFEKELTIVGLPGDIFIIRLYWDISSVFQALFLQYYPEIVIGIQGVPPPNPPI